MTNSALPSTQLDTSGLSALKRLPGTLRPHKNLLTYYVLTSFLLGPGFVFALVPLFFRYHTMRYEIDQEGITMRWGILFRREVSLTFARIQDIHLSSNFVERWLGLAKLQVQTASGSATPEMTMEGLLETKEMRDFLYTRMRGARDAGKSQLPGGPSALLAAPDDELASTLREIAAEIRALRRSSALALKEAFMVERMKAWVMKVLRVPSEPELPVGAVEVRIFRAAPNYFRYRLTLWALVQLGALLGLVVGFFFFSRFLDRHLPFGLPLFHLAEGAAWAVFLVHLPFSFLLLQLDFEMRWYVLSDRSLRIREGILSMREKTMTFANIQNISIKQNPLQRILGLADVQVKTAGGGGGGGEGHGHAGEATHEAWFRGVSNAAEIRSAVQERVRLHRDAGLGDPDEPRPLSAREPRAVLEAARELRQEIRELRRSYSS
mgnify:FL=1